MVRSSCIFGRTVMKIGTDKDNYMKQAQCKSILGRNQALAYTLVFPGSCNTILPCKKLNTCLENSVLCYVLRQGLYLGTTKLLMENYNPSICKEQAIMLPTESGWVFLRAWKTFPGQRVSKGMLDDGRVCDRLFMLVWVWLCSADSSIFSHEGKDFFTTLDICLVTHIWK